jgi:hypothetical protein
MIKSNLDLVGVTTSNLGLANVINSNHQKQSSRTTWISST